MARRRKSKSKGPTKDRFRRFHTYDPMEILRFIIMYKMGNDGNSPSILTIMHRCNISSTSVTANILKALEKEGLIDRVDGQIHVKGARWMPPPNAILEMPIHPEEGWRR